MIVIFMFDPSTGEDISTFVSDVLSKRCGLVHIAFHDPKGATSFTLPEGVVAQREQKQDGSGDAVSVRNPKSVGSFFSVISNESCDAED